MLQEIETKKMKKPLALCLYLLWAIASICLFFYFASKFIQENFGQVTIIQILTHLNIETAANVTLPKIFVKSAAKYISFFLASSGILLYFTYQSIKGKTIFSIIFDIVKTIWCLIKKLYHIIFIGYKTAVPLCAVILVIVSTYALVRFDNRLHVVRFLKQKESVFFTENYYKLDVNSIVPSNKNLLVIFLESVEDGYKDPSIYKANLIQKLEDLKVEGISFSNYRKTPGAYYTMDALCAQLLGVPILHLNIDVVNTANPKYKVLDNKVLLGNTPSIFNLLKNMSYETIAFSGATRTFTHKGAHFEAHGFDAFWGKEYWEKKGFDKDISNKGGNWGFNDEFLFNRLKDYLTNRATDKNFAVAFETVDTHYPAGFVTDVDRRFNDARDSFIRTSRLTSEFIEWAKEQPWYNDTVIVLVGDHPWQDLPKFKLTSFTKKSQNRQIYNLILNSETQPVREIKGWSAMDMAPTILHAMGIDFTSYSVSGDVSHTKIGIGVSLFSKEGTLVEKYGARFLSDELQKPNKFYDSLL